MKMHSIQMFQWRGIQLRQIRCLNCQESRQRERERDFSSVYNEDAFNQDVSMKRHSIKTWFTNKMPELSGEEAVFAMKMHSIKMFQWRCTQLRLDLQIRCLNCQARRQCLQFFFSFLFTSPEAVFTFFFSFFVYLSRGSVYILFFFFCLPLQRQCLHFFLFLFTSPEAVFTIKTHSRASSKTGNHQKEERRKKDEKEKEKEKRKRKKEKEKRKEKRKTFMQLRQWATWWLQLG